MATHALVLDLVEWVAARPRAYTEVMAAWRTSCPRLPIWEDAVDQGLVAREHRDGVAIVTVTPLGRALLEREGRPLNTRGPPTPATGATAAETTAPKGEAMAGRPPGRLGALRTRAGWPG